MQFSAKGLESSERFTGCTFHIRGFGDGLMRFILDIARAGDMVILPAMEGNPLILVSKEQINDVPVDVRENFRSIIVSDAGELDAVLAGGFEGWSAYRDHVVRKPKPETKG